MTGVLVSRRLLTSSSPPLLPSPSPHSLRLVSAFFARTATQPRRLFLPSPLRRRLDSIAMPRRSARSRCACCLWDGVCMGKCTRCVISALLRAILRRPLFSSFGKQSHLSFRFFPAPSSAALANGCLKKTGLVARADKKRMRVLHRGAGAPLCHARLRVDLFELAYEQLASLPPSPFTSSRFASSFVCFPFPPRLCVCVRHCYPPPHSLPSSFYPPLFSPATCKAEREKRGVFMCASPSCLCLCRRGGGRLACDLPQADKTGALSFFCCWCLSPRTA